MESVAATAGSARAARKSKREWNGIGRPPRAKCREREIPFTGNVAYWD
jgi:hypothetical protein